ncbi:MAG: hypothetical protein IJ348_06290 [Alistipes sp.]|nr:hypothetical protein [Alistipes sp.]
MKIICVENLFGEGEPYLSLRPDTAALRNNDDFYLPHFSSNVLCGCGVTLRVTRLAKCLDARFASRCYDGVGVGVAFVAEDVRQREMAAGRPWEAACVFDRSLALSHEEIAAAEVGEGVVEMMLDNELVQKFSVATLREGLDASLARASHLLTLKTGDIIFVQMPVEVKPSQGSAVKVTLNGVELLNFQVK